MKFEAEDYEKSMLCSVATRFAARDLCKHEAVSGYVGLSQCVCVCVCTC